MSNFSCLDGIQHHLDVYISVEKFQSNLRIHFKEITSGSLSKGTAVLFWLVIGVRVFFEISVAISAVTFLPSSSSPTQTALVLASFSGGLSLLKEMESEQMIDWCDCWKPENDVHCLEIVEPVLPGEINS